jgi:hypothetical protein
LVRGFVSAIERWITQDENGEAPSQRGIEATTLRGRVSTPHAALHGCVNTTSRHALDTFRQYNKYLDSHLE